MALLLSVLTTLSAKFKQDFIVGQLSNECLEETVQQRIVERKLTRYERTGVSSFLLSLFSSESMMARYSSNERGTEFFLSSTPLTKCQGVPATPPDKQ